MVVVLQAQWRGKADKQVVEGSGRSTDGGGGGGLEFGGNMSWSYQRNWHGG